MLLFMNKFARKKKAKIPESHSFRALGFFVRCRTYVLNDIALIILAKILFFSPS